MRKVLVAANFADSPGYGVDIVQFEVPDPVIYDYMVIDAIREARSELCSEDFKTMQDLADAAFRNAAIRLKAKWEYVRVAGTVDFDELDDPDPTEYEEEEEA